MSQQARVLAARPRRFDTADVSAAPTDGSTEPMFTGSPVAPTGVPTSGFLFIIKAPTNNPAVPPAAGFSVTPWVRNPVTNVWGSGVTAQIGYNEAWVCGDVGACDLYLQIADADTDGEVDIHFAEQ